MSLQSNLFKGDQALEACLVRDSAHLMLHARGEAVHKVQRAVLVLGKRGIENGELEGLVYGHSTAAAVLDYKQRKKIINRKYQDKADDIVGKMTIAALDQGLVERPKNDPLTNPGESARIQQVLDRERLGAVLMIQTTLKSLSEVLDAFKLADVNPEAAAGLLFVNRFTVEGLDRYFAVNQANYKTWLPKIIANFQGYQTKSIRLSIDQAPADYDFLLRHALMRGPDGKLFLPLGKITGDTPMAFSSGNPRGMFFTPRYRELDPAMPLVFSGLFHMTLRGIQIHEMGHFYFGFADGSPKGKRPGECLRLAASYDFLARAATFRRLTPLDK